MKNGINAKGNYHIFVRDELKYKTCMLSAEKSGVPPYMAVNTIENIDNHEILWFAKMTANYRQMSDGQHLGVEISKTNCFVPRQGWLVLFERNGKVDFVRDTEFWYGKEDVEWACSPASIFTDTKAFYSEIDGVREAKSREVTTQSAFGITRDGKHAFITCLYKVSAVQMWNELKGDFKLLAVMDGGGSAQLEYYDKGVHTFKASNRELPNVLCFYKYKAGKEPAKPEDPTTKTYTEDDINNAIDEYFKGITIEDLKTELKKGIKENL